MSEFPKLVLNDDDCDDFNQAVLFFSPDNLSNYKLLTCVACESGKTQELHQHVLQLSATFADIMGHAEQYIVYVKKNHEQLAAAQAKQIEQAKRLLQDEHVVIRLVMQKRHSEAVRKQQLQILVLERLQSQCRPERLANVKRYIKAIAKGLVHGLEVKSSGP